MAGLGPHFLLTKKSQTVVSGIAAVQDVLKVFLEVELGVKSNA